MSLKIKLLSIDYNVIYIYIYMYIYIYIYFSGVYGLVGQPKSIVVTLFYQGFYYSNQEFLGSTPAGGSCFSIVYQELKGIPHNRIC